ncbi:MAG: hypothetical protein A7316_06840 [Candidatus Altiarchaeales archaeon WOR_SM1_86-2]|nr:MAG: hypothetical protein A7316_06840 [Candidatus Altiarchaeales archaeon WOR_SM1_86-2]ODS39957.1 MAG: hypothetical protein A7315_02760 [Candidatus Altiarchaeales archaeon WOR_SM1_79]
MKYVIDSYAWVEYLDGSKAGRKVKEILESESEVYTSAISIAEIVSKAKRSGADVKVALNAMTILSRIVDIDFNMAKNAGKIHAEMRKKIKDFGLGDCFVLECAKRVNGKVVTGDEHFRGMKNVVFIK